jgi:Cu/Ag efflux protein CusF
MKTMRNLALASALTATLLLSACGGKATTSETAPAMTNRAEPLGNMAAMDMGTPKAKTAQGKGSVIAIDVAAGKVTLDHGAIPETGWPAMTMAFDAKPEVLKGVAVGDRVAFALTLKSGGGEVTAIRKQ